MISGNFWIVTLNFRMCHDSESIFNTWFSTIAPERNELFNHLKLKNISVESYLTVYVEAQNKNFRRMQ